MPAKKIPDKTKDLFTLLEEQQKNIDPKEETLLRKTEVAKIETGSFVFPEETKTIKTDLVCSCCGQEKEEKEFYMTFSLVCKMRKRMNICHSCVDALWASYLARFSNDLRKALYYFCILIDMPYFKNIIEELTIVENNQAFIKKYFRYSLAS